MRIKNVKERKLKSYEEFKSYNDKYQKGGDKNRTVELKDHSKAHPGYNKIKAEPIFTKHDSNIYKAYDIEVDKKYDNTNNYVKPGLTKPETKSDKQMEEIEGMAYHAVKGALNADGVTEAEVFEEGKIANFKIFEEKIYEALDPVGKEDDDIDNDGDVDSSDEYLKKRREKIKDGIEAEEEKVEEANMKDESQLKKAKNDLEKDMNLEKEENEEGEKEYKEESKEDKKKAKEIEEENY